MHVTQALQGLRLDRRSGEAPGDGKLTYHDPCHLRWWSGICEELRQLLADDGWRLTDLLDNPRRSLCYAHFKENAEGVEVLELGEALDLDRDPKAAL